jgi:hypothetical protein
MGWEPFDKRRGPVAAKEHGSLRTGRFPGRAARRVAGALLGLLLGYQSLLPAAQSDQNDTAPQQRGGSQVQILPPHRPRVPALPAQPDQRNELQIPSLRQTPERQPKAAPYAGSQSVHTIPPAFFGCWRGTSLPSDTSQYLGGCPPGEEVSEIQKLCFTRVGDRGYQIAFQSAAAALPNFQDHTELISSAGKGVVNLRDIGGYDFFMFSPHVTFSGSSRCELSSDKDILRCRATTFLSCGGVPWYRTTGRTVLRRVPR